MRIFLITIAIVSLLFFAVRDVAVADSDGQLAEAKRCAAEIGRAHV